MEKYMVNFHLYKKGCLKSFESELIEKASDVVLKVDLPHSQLLCYFYQLHWIRALRWEWSYFEKLGHKAFSHILFIDKAQPVSWGTQAPLSQTWT